MEQVLDMSGAGLKYGIECWDDPEVRGIPGANAYENSLRLVGILQSDFANWLAIPAGLHEAAKYIVGFARSENMLAALASPRCSVVSGYVSILT